MPILIPQFTLSKFRTSISCAIMFGCRVGGCDYQRPTKLRVYPGRTLPYCQETPRAPYSASKSLGHNRHSWPLASHLTIPVLLGCFMPSLVNHACITYMVLCISYSEPEGGPTICLSSTLPLQIVIMQMCCRAACNTARAMKFGMYVSKVIILKDASDKT